MHRGRTNEYELKHNGKEITVNPLTMIDVGSMQKQQGKKPSLTIITYEKEE